MFAVFIFDVMCSVSVGSKEKALSPTVSNSSRDVDGHSHGVPTHLLESQEESGKVRELIWSGKVREFCWWSGNFGSLRMKNGNFCLRFRAK